MPTIMVLQVCLVQIGEQRLYQRAIRGRNHDKIDIREPCVPTPEQLFFIRSWIGIDEDPR